MRSLSVVGLVLFLNFPWGLALAADVAVVNGTPITVDALKARMAGFPAEVQERFNTADGRKELLDAMVTQEVLLQESRRQGLDKDKEIIAKMEEAKSNILVNALIEKLIADKINAKTMEAYYTKHSDEFREIRASHILLKTDAEAKDVLKQIKKGSDFGDLAKKLSQDKGSAESGGDLGFFTQDKMVKPFADKSFTMKVGEISEPVKSQFGYHIIKVTEIRPLKKFADLGEEDKRSLKRSILSAEMDGLKAQAKVTVNHDVIEKMN